MPQAPGLAQAVFSSAAPVFRYETAGAGARARVYARGIDRTGDAR
jgi:hypothetical protein